MWSRLLRPSRLAAAGASAGALAAWTVNESQLARCDGAGRSNPKGLTRQRTHSFELSDHFHGKARVRVLRVHQDGAKHTAHEFSVETRLFSPAYSQVFTDESNSGLVATDTQKNTVYVVAKRSKARTPEGYGVDLCEQLLHEYPVLSAVEVEVTESVWERFVSPCGTGHDHGFVKRPEKALARVRLTRDAPKSPEVVSGFKGLTVLKTTQSGFENYLQDKYTLLPETSERCLATEMSAEWRYTPAEGQPAPDYEGTRATVLEKLTTGFFGPPKGGIFSPSLQCTIYDAGCLVLSAAPRVASISIDTPNIHMIPFHQLKAFGDAFDNDVYVATSDPAGTIHCTVTR